MKTIKSFRNFNEGFVPKAELSEYSKFEIGSIELMDNGKDFLIKIPANDTGNWWNPESYFYCNGENGEFFTNLPMTDRSSVLPVTSNYILNQIEKFCNRTESDHQSVIYGKQILELHNRR